MKTSGIYKIVNKIDGKCYVGSSENILGTPYKNGRFYAHKRLLRLGKHHCIHLQRAYNIYGINNFDFIIVEQVHPTDLVQVEQKYLDEARKNPSMYYNCSYDSGRITMTPEIVSKIKASNQAYQSKKLWTPEERAKMSRKGEKHPMYGKKHTDSSKKKNSESNKIAQKGLNNARADHTIRKFYNKKTGEIFEGTRYEFYSKYPKCRANLSNLIDGTNSCKSIHGWVLDPTAT